MTFSPLIKGTLPHHGKYHSRQGTPITRINQHHWAGIGGGDARLISPTVGASATYIIYSNGDIYGQVPEEFRPWTTSTWAADAPAITIEVQNTTGAFNGHDNDPRAWQISDDAYNAIVRLLADVARRYKWGAIADRNYIGHREVASTACPGGYLWHKMDNIRSAANNLLNGDPTNRPAPKNPPTKGKTIWELANEVMAGLHGNGPERRRSLGNKYRAVQKEINRRAGIVDAPKPEKDRKSVDELVAEVLAGKHGAGDARRKSLGSRYREVQNEINDRAYDAPKRPKKGRRKSVGQLADEVMNGVHGNGAARRKALGKRFDEVQAEINRRLGAGKSRGGPNISQMADAVMRGEYGNGATRRQTLGRHYKAVQAEINRRLGM